MGTVRAKNDPATVQAVVIGVSTFSLSIDRLALDVLTDGRHGGVVDRTAQFWDGILIRIGARAGLAAGIVYLLIQEAAAVLRGEPVLVPLRLFASILLGPTALRSSVNVASVAILGGLVILVASGVFGIVFAGLVHLFPGLAATPGTLVIGGATYGLSLWLGCFYVLGAIFWPWLTLTDPTTQFVAATFGYGVTLGLGFVVAGVHRSPQLY